MEFKTQAEVEAIRNEYFRKLEPRFKVNRVEDKTNNKFMLVLVDTVKTGFPSPWQYDEGELWIYDLCDYLNENIGGN